MLGNRIWPWYYGTKGGHCYIYMQMSGTIKYFDMTSEKFRLNHGDIETIISK